MDPNLAALQNDPHFMRGQDRLAEGASHASLFERFKALLSSDLMKIRSEFVLHGCQIASKGDHHAYFPDVEL
jgi:hypothetical protein